MSCIAKSSIARLFIVTLFLIFLPLGAYAQAGCCSSHGGVAGCNKATNFLSCTDGTTSPSCTCSGSTVKPEKAAKAEPAAATAAAGTPADNSAAAKKEAKAEKAEKAKEAKAEKEAKAKQAKADKEAKAKEAKAAKTGCCSGHGGVAKCNKSAGFQMCKDGTQSSTCACGKKK